MIIPLIVIPVKSNLTMINSLYKLTYTTGHDIQGKEIMANTNTPHVSQNIIIVLFLIVSSILLIRFAINIFRIIKKIKNCKKVENGTVTLILVEETTLPYSFLRYVFVNKSDFESGEIKKELLMHEEAHCLQYHSVDIILLELINILFWFNPVIWLFRRAIILNHEYCADNKAMANNEASGYNKLLVNLVLQSNTNYLVSSFNYSLIKNRITMMTKSRPSHNAIISKITAITLFLFLGIEFTFSQENSLNKGNTNFTHEWWYPIIQKHNIDLKQFNYKNAFTVSRNDTISGYYFEMGNSDSLNNRNLLFKDAILISQENDSTYWIHSSTLAYHNYDNNMVIMINPKVECFSFRSKEVVPTKTSTYGRFILYIDKGFMVATSPTRNEKPEIK